MEVAFLVDVVYGVEDLVGIVLDLLLAQISIFRLAHIWKSVWRQVLLTQFCQLLKCSFWLCPRISRFIVNFAVWIEVQIVSSAHWRQVRQQYLRRLKSQRCFVQMHDIAMWTIFKYHMHLFIVCIINYFKKPHNIRMIQLFLNINFTKLVQLISCLLR